MLSLKIPKQINIVRHAYRLFGTHTRPALMGAGSHQSDDDPRVIEREKQKTLAHKNPVVIKTAPGWNPLLASDSEADVAFLLHLSISCFFYSDDSRDR